MADEFEVPNPARNNSGQFVKGQSGNPLGGNRPYALRRILHGDETKREVNEIYKEALPKAFEVLMLLMLDRNVAPSIRMQCAKELNNRGLGKPAITLQTQAAPESDDFDTSTISVEALREVIAAVKESDRSDD